MTRLIPPRLEDLPKLNCPKCAEPLSRVSATKRKEVWHCQSSKGCGQQIERTFDPYDWKRKNFPTDPDDL